MSHSSLPAPLRRADPKRSDVEWLMSHDPEDQEWDAFVAAHRESQGEQTSMWGEARSAFRWQAWRVVIRRGGRILGGVQCFEFQIKSIIKVGYICRGPVVDTDVDPKLIWDAVLWAVALRGILYVAITFPYWGHDFLPAFLSRGGIARPTGMPPSVWSVATSTIDLTLDEATLLGNVRKTARKHIRRAEQAGLTVELGTEKDLPTFYQLMLSLCRRREVSPNIPGEGFVALLWTKLSRLGACQLMVCKLNGETVSSLFLITLGSWVRAWRIGWSGEHDKSYPSELIYWESILWAKRNGYRYFDMGGIDGQDADELIAGRPAAAPFHSSTTFFKLGFGGDILRMPGEYCYFPNPIFRFLFRIVGKRLLESRIILQGLQRVYAALFPRSGG